MGRGIASADLRIPKARETAYTLQAGALPFMQFLEYRRLDPPADAEVVVFDVEIELGQVKVHDIHRHERIAVIFYGDDKARPEVLALRDDFPGVPHINLRRETFPRSLCLFEERYSELKLRWTAARFLERIREWLALTARGELHAEDQPLEPLLLGSLRPLVIPFDLLTKIRADAPELLKVRVVEGSNNRLTFIGDQGETDPGDQQGFKFFATIFQGAPQPHGIIHKQPNNLHELHEFLIAANIDLLQELRTRLRAWQERREYENLIDTRLILIVVLPKTRGTLPVAEATDIWAFMCASTIGEIGEQLGIWAIHNGQTGILLNTYEDKRGDQVEITLLNPTDTFSRNRAAQLNGLACRESNKIVAIGQGALGSQVLMNLVRMGYGEWTLIDEDYFLPHNQARHALFSFAVGFSKAQALAVLANRIVGGQPIATALVADVLNPGTLAERVDKALTSADIILDTSASVAVARYLACDIDPPARRLSLFLNPSGLDLVLLAEDMEGKTPLDFLEMQYYRHLINEPSLRNHLRQSDNRIRYARSCRDLSGTIPQDLVALHAAIGSRALRRAVANEGASIAIWQADSDNLSVKGMQVDVAEMIEQHLGDWILRTDQRLLDKILQARLEKLPNETGGVLIGSFDTQRKIVYVLDTVLSPPDSTEWPAVYIRGCQGLTQRVEEIATITAGMLEYVGEWHSHPHARNCTPSSDDRKAFIWLANQMKKEGLPALMLIAGDHKQHAWYLERMP
jgi:integrative and conjugative element protein (TIGR02256 family)